MSSDADDLAALVHMGRASWPHIDLAPETFAADIRARLTASDPDAGGHAASLAPAQAKDLYLACACLHGLESAWRELDRLYLAKVGDYIARVDRSPSFADEVRQRLAEKLSHGVDGGPPKLALYTGRGSLEGWLRIAAIREARNAKRGARWSDDPDDVKLAAPGDDPEIQLLKRRFAKEFKEAFEEVLATLEPDDRSVLRLHYLDGLTVEEVGRAFRVSRATAARRIAAAKETIIAQVRERLATRLGAGAPAPASMLAFVQSQLDWSLRRHFEPGDSSEPER
jgi:RNA polymerase sigma-70 factor (ECF subfamily)